MRKDPVLTSLILFAVALCLRLLDLFVLRLDERFGEIILSKLLGFVLVLAYLRLVNLPLPEIGLHSRSLAQALAIPALGVGSLLVLAYGAQWAALTWAGRNPRLVITPLDPKTGLAGGWAFAVWLVFGNFVNSFMEEGLFRGVMLRHFLTRLPAWQANLAQAALFSVWHFVWPLKSFLTGKATLIGTLAEAALLGSGTLVSGFAYGYLYYRTGSLWAPWLAHTLNNTAFNLVHLQTSAGLGTGLLLQIVAVAGLLPVMALTKFLSAAWNLPGIKPWGR